MGLTKAVALKIDPRLANCLKNEDALKKASAVDDDHPSSSFSPLTPFLRSFSSSSAVDISAHNNATMDVLDVKTMLLKMKRLLEQVTQMCNK